MILKAMWPIKGRHRHLDAETLSAYLDGRIEGPAQARLERSLADCAICNEELASLRATVALIRQLPVEAPARSFVMAAPPRQPARPRPSPLARASMWAYAGAASVAAVVLTVLVSADATGILAPGQPTGTGQSAIVLDSPEQMAESAPAGAPDVLVIEDPTAVMESAESFDEPAAMAEADAAAPVDSFDEPEATAEADAAAPADSFEEPEAMMDAEPTEAPADSAAMADADVPADSFDEQEAMADAGSAEPAGSFDESEGMLAAEPTVAPDDSDAIADADAGDQIPSPVTEAPEPTLEAATEATLEEPVPTAVSQVGPTDTDATASTDHAVDTVEPLSTAVPEALEAPAPVEQASPPPAAATEQAVVQVPSEAPTQGAEIQSRQPLTEAEPKQAPVTPAKGTALYWRILEGLAAALVLLFLTALGFTWWGSGARPTDLGR